MKLSRNVKEVLYKVVALVMAVLITATLSVASAAADVVETPTISQGTVWTYSDTGVDPAGDSADRTSWTKADYDTTDWKTGVGSFGAKKGGTADLGGGCTPVTLLTQYKEDNTTNIEAFFFRTTVNVEKASEVKQIIGSVQYDDSATVYINGNRIAGFYDNAITENMQYGGNNGSAPLTGEISVTEGISDILVNGENVVAVEIHQTSANSSDIYFNMPSLTFSTEEPEAPTISSISVSMGSNESQRNFTWYYTENTTGKLLVAKESELVDGAMPANAAAFAATVTEASNKTGYYSYKATASSLENNCAYAYQLVSGDARSEIKTFKTGTGSSFSFAFAGDPQIGASGNTVSDADGWDKTVSLIENRAELSGVDFMLSAGDQVNTANDESQYDSYLNHSTLANLPVATVIGNHDTSSAAYDEHFNIPNKTNYGSTSAGGDYYFVYNNVLFMALNSNNLSTAEHTTFMKEAMAATQNQNITWKVVTFHHSIYSVANHASEPDIIERRNALSTVFKELDIDVVLMGHDHVYCRTYMMDGLTPMTDAAIYDDENYSSITNPEGILYVTANSASGSKFYNIQSNTEFPYSRVMNQERIPNISRIDVSDGQFTITTYRTSDMSEVDTFTIYHKQDYTVTTDESEHGSVSADVSSAYAGETVTLTATPEDGYAFAGWNVVSGNVTVNDDNTFTMPEGNVEIQAVFEHIHTYDKWSMNDTKHWRNCTANDGGIGDEGEHSMQWVVDREASGTKDGVKHEECSICGYKQNVNTAIPATGNDGDSRNAKPSGAKNGTSAKPTSAVDTGDNSHGTTWILIALICGGAAAGVGTTMKKRNK